MNTLQELAEKGQINAVQKWYLFNNKGVNSKIDAIVEGYKGDSYNELFAKAMIDYDKFGEYLELIQKMYDEHEKWQSYDCEQNYKNFGNLRKTIYEYPLYSNLIKAIKLAREQGEKSNNYLVLETMNEILNEYKRIAPYDYNELAEENRGMNRRIKRELYRQYKELKSQGKTATDNPQLCFALGKACCDFPSDPRFFAIGLSMLEELAEREYTQVSSQTQFSK